MRTALRFCVCRPAELLIRRGRIPTHLPGGNSKLHMVFHNGVYRIIITAPAYSGSSALHTVPGLPRPGTEISRKVALRRTTFPALRPTGRGTGGAGRGGEAVPGKWHRWHSCGTVKTVSAMPLESAGAQRLQGKWHRWHSRNAYLSPYIFMMINTNVIESAVPPMPLAFKALGPRGLRWHSTFVFRYAMAVPRMKKPPGRRRKRGRI